MSNDTKKKTGKFFTAKPKRWKADRNSNDKPRVLVMFELPEFPKGIWYEKYLIGGNIPIAVEHLVLMGFAGASANDLNNPKALNDQHEVSILVDKESWEDKATGETKSVMKVMGIWPAEGSVSEEDQDALSGLDLRGYIKNSDAALVSTPNGKAASKNPEDYSQKIYDQPSDEDVPDWAK